MKLTYEQTLLKKLESANKKEKRLLKRLALAKGKPKKLGIRELKKELKKVTHAIVRLKYDHCYSCGKYVEPKDRQAGHYFTDGGNPGTRYHFDNIRTQHAICNYNLGGDAAFGARLLREIGQERFLKLDEIRKIPLNYTPQDYQRLILERKDILDTLKKSFNS